MSIELQEVATTEANWQLAGAELGTAQPKLVFKSCHRYYKILQHCTLYIISEYCTSFYNTVCHCIILYNIVHHCTTL